MKIKSNIKNLPAGRHGKKPKTFPFLICVFGFWFLIFGFRTSAQAFQSELLRQVWDIPTGEVKAKTVKAYNKGNISVEEIYYFSRPYKRNPVKIFGYYCYPTVRSDRLPAILLSHGGGGTASLPRAVSWARRGYTVLAIDLPGKGENRSGSRSTGPNMDVSVLLRTQPDPSYNYLIHAVAAARNGITYLANRKEVDPDRIGMIGLSWGGVITLLTNGQDDRLKAAVNVFGAGYIPEGCTWEDWFTSMSVLDKELWDNYIDPKNFLLTQHAPILFITGTNDHCYYLPTFQKSYDEIKVEKRALLIPNLRHRFLSSATEPALAWLDQKLKRKNEIFPTVAALTPFQKDSNRIIIPVEAVVHSSVRSLHLYYTSGGPQQWTQKNWKELSSPYKEDNTYYFAIPVNLIKPEILYYASVTDNHGGAASSLVQSLFAVKLKDGTKTFAFSSPIKKIYSHENPIRLVNESKRENLKFLFSKKDKTYQVFQTP